MISKIECLGIHFYLISIYYSMPIDFERKPRLLSGEIYNLPSFVSLGEFYYPINVKSPTYDLRQLNARSREHLSGSRTQHVRLMIYDFICSQDLYPSSKTLCINLLCQRYQTCCKLFSHAMSSTAQPKKQRTERRKLQNKLAQKTYSM